MDKLTLQTIEQNKDQTAGDSFFNYTGLYYELLGNRLERLHGEKTSQMLSKEMQIAPSVISNVLTGSIYSTHNPYLISKNNLQIISKYFNMTVSEFAWGDLKERERFISIILFAILFNGTGINPFIYFESEIDYFRWALRQFSPGESIYKYIETAISFLANIPEFDRDKPFRPLVSNFDKKEYKLISINNLHEILHEYFEKKYDFFYSRNNHKYFKKLLGDSECIKDGQLNDLRILLIKHLLCDFKFIVFIYKHTIDSRNFEKAKIRNYKDLLIYFMESFDAIDFNTFINYKPFTDAFNRFWDLNKNDYVNYFNKNFFNDNSRLKSGFKYYQNNDFDEFIKSHDFIEFNETLLETKKLSDKNAILSELFIRINAQWINQEYKHKAKDLEYDNDYFVLLDNLIKELDTYYRAEKQTLEDNDSYANRHLQFHLQ